MSAGYSHEIRGPVLILEDDESLARIVQKELEDEGASEIDLFYDGKEAWEALTRKKYQFLILDWKVPGLTSLSLINRLKDDREFRHIPVLVMSGYLQQNDFSLFSEFSNVGAVEKPFAGPFFIRKLKSVCKEAIWFQKQEKKLAKMVEKILNVEDHKRSEVMTEFLDSAPNPVPISIILGKELRERKEWRLSELALKWGLKYNDSNVVILSELGKLYLSQGSLKKAKTFLARADQSSPKNLERICGLGNIHLQELNTEKAGDFYNRALELDPDNQAAKDGKVVSGHLDKWLNTTISVPDTFAGILNAVGIGMVRSGDYNQGIEYYNSALSHVESDRLKSRLSFNLGLAYLRWHKATEALTWMEKSKEYDPNNEKARDYISKILRAKKDLEKNNRSIQGEVDIPGEFNEDPASVYIIEGTDEDDEELTGIV